MSRYRIVIHTKDIPGQLGTDEHRAQLLDPENWTRFGVTRIEDEGTAGSYQECPSQ